MYQCTEPEEFCKKKLLLNFLEDPEETQGQSSESVL